MADETEWEHALTEVHVRITESSNARDLCAIWVPA
jgi:hypothetical protein